MITVVEGRPGMGKSIWLVSEIERYLQRGHSVYTNVDLSHAPKRFLDKYSGRLFYIESLEDIIKLKQGKVVLDEVQTYLNSRNWDKLDIRFQLLLQQHRKRGLDIIGATQSIKRADVVFRELVQVFYRIRKIVSFKVPILGPIGFFYLREYDPDDMESGGAKSKQKSIGGFLPMFFFADSYMFHLYDTTQEYAPESRVGTRVVEEYVIGLQPPQEVRQLVSREVIEAPVLSESVLSSPVDKSIVKKRVGGNV